jgi:hypothetical protein
MDRFKTRPFLAALAAAAVTALGVGGVAIAQSGSSPTEKPGTEQSAPENSATDPDNVQDENGKDDATEKGDAKEKGDAAEKGDKTEKKGAEVPNDDGADGGHADEAKK